MSVATKGSTVFTCPGCGFRPCPTVNNGVSALRCLACGRLHCNLCIDPRQKEDEALCVSCGGPTPPEREAYL